MAGLARSTAIMPIAGVPITGDASQPSGYTAFYGPGSYTFTPTKSGYWKFVMWAGGGIGESTKGGDSGAYFEKTVFLDPQKSVALTVGANAGNSSATFPDGSTALAGAAGGVATGGDVNLNGSIGGTSAPGAAGLGTGGGAGGAFSANTGGGAGAPAMLPFRGGVGQQNTNNHTQTPGGGGAYNSGGESGGSGLCIVMFVRN